MKISFKTNIKDVIKDMDAWRYDVKPATVRALNKTIAQVKVRASRTVRDAGYKLRIGDIKEAISIVRATGSSLSASMIGKGRPISLIKYNARQVGAGVNVDVLHGRKTIAHAFIATMPNGGKQVMTRIPGRRQQQLKNGHIRKNAQPIKKLYGPSIPDALINEAVTKALLEFMGNKFPQVLASEIRFVSGKA